MSVRAVRRTYADIVSGSTSLLIGQDTVAASAPEKLASVRRATSLIVDPIAQVPYRVTSRDSVGSLPPVQTPTPRWLSDPTLVRADERVGPQAFGAVQRVTASVFWGELVRSALWYGKGVFMYRTDAAGQPQAGQLRMLHPWLVRPAQTPEGWRWQVGADSYGNDAGAIIFDRDGQWSGWTLAVLRNPASSVVQGESLGVFEMTPDAFGLAAEVQNYARTTFRSGVPSGVLNSSQPKLSQEQADELKEGWMEAHGGDRRSVAVLNATTEFTPISFSPVDAGLVDANRMSIAGVAHAFGLDPGMLGVSTESGMTYANQNARWAHYRASSLGIWITGVEELMTSLVATGSDVQLDFRSYSKADITARFDAYAKAERWLSINEVRDLEGLPPVPGGDELEALKAPEPVPAALAQGDEQEAEDPAELPEEAEA